MTKVACIQLWHSDDDSKEDRIAHAEQLIDGVTEADLILLPEVWNIGWWSTDIYQQESETLQGETVSRLAAKAKAVNAYVMAGSIVERREDGLYNTTALLDPKGQIVASYSKMHLIGWGGAEESKFLKPGKEIVTVKTDIGVLGLAICYDLRFPEQFRKMAVNQGAEIFLVVSAWPVLRLDNWRVMCNARATENQCYMVACNCAGINRGKQFLGYSNIVDPLGTIIASTGTFGSVVRGEIDVAEVERIRNEFPILQDRVLPV